MRQCRSCGGCCGGGYVKGRKYIPCKSTASPVRGDAELTVRDARITELEKENAALRDRLDTLEGLAREYKLAEDDQAHAPKSIRVARADLFAYLDKLAAERPTPDTDSGMG